MYLRHLHSSSKPSILMFLNQAKIIVPIYTVLTELSTVLYAVLFSQHNKTLISVMVIGGNNDSIR